MTSNLPILENAKNKVNEDGLLNGVQFFKEVKVLKSSKSDDSGHIAEFSNRGIALSETSPVITKDRVGYGIY